jgi:hypothetical protein
VQMFERLFFWKAKWRLEVIRRLGGGGAQFFLQIDSADS